MGSFLVVLGVVWGGFCRLGGRFGGLGPSWGGLGRSWGALGALDGPKPTEG